MQWACNHCGTLHTQNPSECRRCSNRTFNPVSDDEMPSSDRDEPEAVASDQVDTYGTTPDESYESGPDVAVDGSVAANQQRSSEQTTATDQHGHTTLRSAWYTLRATILAPIGLLREFLVPILAFAVVAGIVVWFLL